MKKSLFLMPALLLTLGLSAQKPCHGGKGGPGGPKYGMQQHGPKEAFDKLNLTDAQKATLKKEREKFQADMQALNKQENITVKAQRDQREAMMKAHKANMEKVLTPDQKKQLTDMRTQQQAKMKEKAAEHMAHMKTDLNLTDAQVNTLKASADKRHEQMKALQENESMDRTARQNAMEKIHEDAKADMKKVLTPEQYEKWQDMRQDMRKPGHGKGHGQHFTR